jgi:hypothetical protein
MGCAISRRFAMNVSGLLREERRSTSMSITAEGSWYSGSKRPGPVDEYGVRHWRRGKTGNTCWRRDRRHGDEILLFGPLLF